MTTNATIEQNGTARNVRERAKSAPEAHVKDQPRTEKARPRVVVADDEASARSGLGTLLRDEGFDVILTEDGSAALAQVQESAPDILVTDLRMPGMDGIELLRRAREADPELIVVLMTAFAEVETAVRAMQEGAEHYLTKPLQIDELVLVLRRALDRRTLRNEATELRARLKEHLHFDNIVGASPAMQEVFDVVEQVAPTKASVLITGESGTGKELVAQAIHMASARANKPFVVVDCGAIPASLAESALFGHERGSFTGAVDRRISPFVEADGGTIFLDELGELPVDVQPKLLRALAEQRVKSVGSNSYRPVNVRVIAATRRDLVREVNAGTFRSDLYFRVAQLKVELPSLRQRLEDIPVLVRRMIEELGDKDSYARIPTDSLERLMRHDWPGNVRELRNVLERGAVVTAGTVIQIQDLGLPARGEAPPRPGTMASLEEVERRHVSAVLSHTGGNVSQSARILGIDRVTLYNKMKKWGLRRDGGEEDGVNVRESGTPNR
jgi:DNA-binding NtrC family response regulator